MRLSSTFHVAVVVLLAPALAQGQTTVDGVTAIVRGQYETAARNLAPLALAPSEPDPMAQFFLALLYDSGQGVPGSSVRACGLHLEVASRETPLRKQAEALAFETHQGNPLMIRECEREVAELRREWLSRPPVEASRAGPSFAGTGDAGATTEVVVEGAAAFVRGDYSPAAELLGAVVAAFPPGDRLAEFILGIMYENGLGVATDQVRACALYLRSWTNASHPITQRFFDIVRPSQQSLSPDAFRRCNLLALVGFDHRFEPAVFNLGPAHWVSVDLDAATVGHKGAEKRTELGLDMPGSRFLPVQHTTLRTQRTSPERRDFIELFWWTPNPTRTTWMLSWRLDEVVADELTLVTIEEVARVDAPSPPDPFDVREVVRLRTNEYGHAEWTLLGADPITKGIPSAAEKREGEEQRARRLAADAQVDWRRSREAKRPPDLRYSDADGCGRAFLFGWSIDRTEAIAINASLEQLRLSTGSQSFDLTVRTAGLDVAVHLFEQPRRRWPFCTDFFDMDSSPAATWRAVGGTITFDVSPPGVRADQPSYRRVSIALVGAEFVGPGGVRVRQRAPITLSAVVGGVHG